MNPYMQKKAMKAYWKQQKYLAKYGQYGLGGGAGAGAYGYPYSNEIDADILREENGDDPNLMGLIHPYSEGDDYQHKTQGEDPEFITDMGH